MLYPRSSNYSSPEFLNKIMGPNPLKLIEEALAKTPIEAGSVVCDLGSGQGLTSVFMAKEYGLHVYAADLWSDPEENKQFFEAASVSESVFAVKADATNLPFKAEQFDAIVSTDSYNYFGRDKSFLDEKLLPFLKSGGLIVVTLPGMKRDLHDNLPEELLISWTPEELDYIHDVEYWFDILSACKGADILCVEEMTINEEAWADWVVLENEYAKKDRKAFEAGACKYLNFVQFALKKK